MQSPPPIPARHRRIALTIFISLEIVILLMLFSQPLLGFHLCLGDTREVLFDGDLSLDSFVKLVQKRGLQITYQKASGDDVWHLSGQVYNATIDGAGISIYEYRTGVAAYMETRCFTDANAVHPGLGGVINVDTFQPTYWFRKGNLIIVYVGQDKGVISLLHDILGSPFQGPF